MITYLMGHKMRSTSMKKDWHIFATVMMDYGYEFGCASWNFENNSIPNRTTIFIILFAKNHMHNKTFNVDENKVLFAQENINA